MLASSAGASPGTTPSEEAGLPETKSWPRSTSEEAACDEGKGGGGGGETCNVSCQTRPPNTDKLKSEGVGATLKHGITGTRGQGRCACAGYTELLLRGRATETRAESAVQHV